MPRHPLPGFALVLLSAALGAQPARADDAVSVELVGKALVGHDRPRLVVHVNAPVAGLTLELQRSDGKSLRQNAGRLGAGAQKAFALDQPEGTFHYVGRLVAKFPRGAPSELVLTFDASLYGPPELEVKDDAVDLAAHTCTIAMKRDPETLHVKVFGDDGAVIDEVNQSVQDKKAGEPLVARWEQLPGAVVIRVAVRAEDRHGYFRDVDLFPWKVEIPHEDVLFDSGKSDVLAAERPKLDAAYDELAKAIARYGKVVAVQLFVGGFTDSVGDGASNQHLSEARALSIARYFRQKGARLATHYAGFGENGLLVPTPDETPEARNRRATYTIAVEPPRGVKWSKLP